MMDCCDVDTYDAEQSTVTESVERTARKEHVCYECGSKIARGERYENNRSLHDGEWFTVKTCAPCLGIRRDFFAGGWIYGGLRADFYECQGFDYLGLWPERDK